MMRENPNLTPTQAAILIALDSESTLQEYLNNKTPFENEALKLITRMKVSLQRANNDWFFDNKVLRKSLRQQILEQRRQVTPIKAYEAGVEIVKILSHHKHFLQKKMVGSYLSLGGELSTEPINEYLLEHHELALPFMDVHVKGHMDFYSYKKGDRLIETASTF